MRSFARDALLVAPRAADRGIEPVLGHRVEQRRRLELVARRARSGLLDDAAAVDRLLHGGDDEALAQLRDPPVTELDHLGKVVTGVDVHERKREAARAKRLLGQPEQHDRVLAAGEQEHRPLELRGDLAHDVDCLRLELVEVGEPDESSVAISRRAGRTRSSRSPLQRPSRPWPGWVQWVQPIEE